MRLLVSFGLIILLSGCASLTNSYTSTIQSWRGGSAASLVKHWGKPDIKVVGQSGNTFYIYRSKVYSAPSQTGTYGPQIGVNTSAKGHPVITMAPPTAPLLNRNTSPLYCTAAFEVNKQGIIVNTDTKGTGCYASSDFEARMKNPVE